VSRNQSIHPVSVARILSLQKEYPFVLKKNQVAGNGNFIAFFHMEKVRIVKTALPKEAQD
jgi:hypothetical protein